MAFARLMGPDGEGAIPHKRRDDFVSTALLINPERADKYAFTMPVAAAKIGIMRQKDGSRLKSIDDLTGLTIGSPVPPAGPTTAFQHYNDELKAKGNLCKLRPWHAALHP